MAINNKTWGTHCYILPQVLKALTSPPSRFPLRVAYVCLLYDIQSFLALRGKTKEEWGYSVLA